MKLIKRQSRNKALLTDDERKQFEDDLKRYIKAYPYLQEPVALDMLEESLLIKIRMQRWEAFVLDSSTDAMKRLTAEKLVDALQRTLSLYFTRLGITYVSRQRRKEQKQRERPHIQENEE